MKGQEVLHRHHADMQKLLISISSGLINTPLEEVDEAIGNSLEELGTFVGADRVYIFEYSKKGTTISCTYNWSADGVNSVLSNTVEVPVEGQLRELLRGHSKGEHLFIADVPKMADGVQKDIFLSQNVQSLVTVPMLTKEKCLGFVGFDWVHSLHVLEDEEVLVLRLFSEMLVNIRQRVKSERATQELFEKTADQNQRLKDFSYITSHNFKSSVANIMGLVSVIEEDRLNDTFFGMLKDSALKLNLAVDSLNDLLNFEKDISSLAKVECNLLQAAKDILVLHKKYIEEKGIQFHIDIPKDLTVKILPAYLQSIIQNLITNAIKYGTTEEKKEIWIKAKKLEGKVLIEIIDSGLGIDLSKFKGKVFQLGARFHPEKSEGHGMGLYMTRQQVKAIGGEINVESRVNEGTKFSVYFNEK